MYYVHNHTLYDCGVKCKHSKLQEAIRDELRQSSLWDYGEKLPYPYKWHLSRALLRLVVLPCEKIGREWYTWRDGVCEEHMVEGGSAIQEWVFRKQ